MEEKNKIEEFFAPSVETRKRIKKAVNDYAYYFIIALISMIVMFVPPLCAGCLQGEVGLFFPKTLEGWILWGLVNGASAIGNVSLLILFKLQAKKNSSNNPNFIKANEILNRMAGCKEVFIPRSPEQMNRKEYITKSVFIIFGTLSSFMVLSSIVLNFDPVTLISTVLSVLMSLCISWVTMLKNEEYWQEEYLLYAEMLQKKLAAQKAAESVRTPETEEEA